MSALVITPSTLIARSGGAVTFVASGGTGTGYVFSFANPGDNASGATLNGSTGAYVAGPKTIVEDKITVTDSGSATAIATVSICANLYRNYQSNIVRTGDWQGPRIKLLEADLGTEKDIQFERARQGVLSNNPATCPDDALAYIGEERGLPQATGESLGNYRERLRTAWDRNDGWLFAGSHGSLLLALQRAGFPAGDPNGCHVIQRIKLYSWIAAGVVTFGTHADWTFGAEPAGSWNQFAIVFGADPAVPVGSSLADGDPSAALLNSIVAQWKPAKALFMGTWVVLSGSIWGWPPSTALWGAGGRTWGGSSRFVHPS